MRKRNIYIIAILSGLTLVAVLGMLAGERMKKEVSKTLGGESNYEDIDVAFYQRDIRVLDVKVREGKKNLFIRELALKNLNYLAFIKDGTIHFDEVSVKEPKFVVDHSTKSEGEKKEERARKIEIDRLILSDGIVEIKNKEAKRNRLFLRVLNLKVRNIRIDSVTRRKLLPFAYDSFEVRGDSVAIHLNSEHKMTVGSFSRVDGHFAVNNLQIIPRFERQEFDQRIPFEKDWISLKVHQVNLDSLSVNFSNDTLRLNSPITTVTGADLEIYRNKLLQDDSRKKTLFSEKIRALPVKLDLTKLQVDKSLITYEEKVQESGPLSTVTFEDINGTIENLSNIGMDKEDFQQTTVSAEARLMGQSPLDFHWSFDISDLQDHFRVSGNFGEIEGETLNPFLKPSVGLAAEGKLKSVAFTFSGAEDNMAGDVRVLYDQFKLLLEEDESDQDGLFTALANLFVDNNGISENRVIEIQVSRDKTKSFWNLIWKGLKKGIIDTLSQLN